MPRQRLEGALKEWRNAGMTDCDGVVCDPIPLEALSEVWDPMRHDEVIVSTLPGQSSKWIRSDLPHAVARFTGVSVLHVVAHDPESHVRPRPRPVARASPARAAVGARVGRPPKTSPDVLRVGRSCRSAGARVSSVSGMRS